MAIKMQNKIFGQYCMSNKDAIKSGNINQLNDASFVVNDKIQFSLKAVVTKSRTDAATARSIMKHLQYILYCLHPDADLKTALATPASLTPSGRASSLFSSSSNDTDAPKSKEEQLFDNLLGTMSNKFGNVTDPSQAFSAMQNGNFMQEIQQTIGGGIESGEIDPSKLLQNAFGMFGKLKSEVNDPGLMGMMSMVEGLLNQAKGAMN